MPGRAFLALDLGAESGRAIGGTLDHGVLAARELHRFPTGMTEIDGRHRWDIHRMLGEMKAGLRAAGSVVSIGVDTWGVDFGLLAATGGLLGLPYAYRDRRTEGAMASFYRKLPRDEVYGRTGIQHLPFNTLYQLEAMVRDCAPELAHAADLLFIPDLFHYFLTGVKATEFTFATTSQLFNPQAMAWDDALIAALGVKRSLFQDVVQPGTVIGALSREITAETGASARLVAVATHDTGSAVAAVPSEGGDAAFICSGTWSLVGIESPRPLITPETRAFNLTNEGGVCGTFRVLRNVMGLWLVQETRRSLSRERAWGYDELSAAAEAAPPFASLVDPDDPSFLNPPDMPEAIRAYCGRTGQPRPESPGALVRCALESLALKYRFVLERLAAVRGAPLKAVHVIGGGSKNRLLCRFTADAAGLPVIAGPAEATAIGNLLVQAMALGDIGSLGELRGVVKRSFELERCEPAAPGAWDAAYLRFLALNPA